MLVPWRRCLTVVCVVIVRGTLIQYNHLLIWIHGVYTYLPNHLLSTIRTARRHVLTPSKLYTDNYHQYDIVSPPYMCDYTRRRACRSESRPSRRDLAR